MTPKQLVKVIDGRGHVNSDRPLRFVMTTSHVFRLAGRIVERLDKRERVVEWKGWQLHIIARTCDGTYRQRGDVAAEAAKFVRVA